MKREKQDEYWDEMSALWKNQKVDIPKDWFKKIREKTRQNYIISGIIIIIFGVMLTFG